REQAGGRLMSTTTLVGTPDPNEPTNPTTGATVLPFTPRPTDAVPADAVPGTALEPAGEVVDGELVPATENAAIDARLRAQVARRAVQVVRVIGTHERTTQLKTLAGYRARKAPQDAARLTWFAIRGHGRWIVKGW